MRGRVTAVQERPAQPRFRSIAALLLLAVTGAAQVACYFDVCARNSDCPPGLTCSVGGSCIAAMDALGTDAGTGADTTADGAGSPPADAAADARDSGSGESLAASLRDRGTRGRERGRGRSE